MTTGTCNYKLWNVDVMEKYPIRCSQRLQCEGFTRAIFPVGNFLWVLSEELVTAFWTGSCGPVFGIHTTYYSISWLMEEFINLMISQFVYWSLCELRIGYFSTTPTFQSSQLQVPTFHFEQIESSGASKLQSSRVRLRMDIYACSYGCCTCVEKIQDLIYIL